MRGEGETDWDGEMREWIKGGGGERKEVWDSVKHLICIVLIETFAYALNLRNEFKTLVQSLFLSLSSNIFI